MNRAMRRLLKRKQPKEYTYFDRRGNVMVHLAGTSVDEDFRLDKMVYSKFGPEADTPEERDPYDESWDVEHIDGDYQNCAIDNLKLINDSD